MASVQTNNTVLFATNGDTFTPVSSAKVCGVKLSGAAASKAYRLRKTDASGGVLWEHKTGASVTDIQADEVSFVIGTEGLHLETDDTVGPAFKVIVYLEA